MKIKTMKIVYPGKLDADFTKMLKVGYDLRLDETTVMIDRDIYDSFCEFIKEVVINGEIVSKESL